jgi:hypothetical protein
MQKHTICKVLLIFLALLLLSLSAWQDLPAQTKPTGYCSVAGLSVTPNPVLLGKDFSISFSLKETKGFSKAFESIVVAIHGPDGSYLFDFAAYDNVTIGANETWSRTSTKPFYITNPTGTYKAAIRGKVGGQWFDFAVTGNGVNPIAFPVVFRAPGP